MQRREGTKLPVKIRRDGQTIDLQIAVRSWPSGWNRDSSSTRSPSAKALRIRNGILKGKA